MCHQGCGVSIQRIFNECLVAYKKEGLLPEDTKLSMDAEPHVLGIHRLFITIESRNQPLNQHTDTYDLMIAEFKKRLKDIELDVIDNQESASKSTLTRVNWINILINLASMGAIFFLSWIFPPSGLLTFGLFSIAFLTTAFTARVYLIDFFHNFGGNHLANMSTTVTLGWLLSLMHALYHSIAMPLSDSFSMIFMSFIMPILLIAVINGMDEVKRLVMGQSRKMHLQGMKTLFPQMADQYNCDQLAPEAEAMLSQVMPALFETVGSEKNEGCLLSLQQKLASETCAMERKNSLKTGVLLQVLQGECFPVDCRVLHGSTVVDASLLTGEPQQMKQCWDFIPAGALNLGQPVTVLAMGDAYHGTVNKLLFRSNRAKTNIASDSTRQFTYFYIGLIGMGIIASIITPYFLGILTLPLLLQNVTGILFAVCPCTIAIAHQLPLLLSMYQRSNKGIILRDENVIRQTNDIHTVVFDKTGTLTTGMSQVESSDGISGPLWERIYLLEKHHGAAHPLAKAMMNHYEKNGIHESIFQAIQKVSVDSKHRGLSAVVQGVQLDIGNAAYLATLGIRIPATYDLKIAQGFTPVYVAEGGVYQGVIFIRHEIRKDILASLTRLKNEGKNIIMLTGDSRLAALGFNQQNGAIFDEANIHAAQTPEEKERFLSELMGASEKNPRGVWFVGDGLNDAPSARIVTEKGGVSCAMTSNDKAAFFTDISLNGSLDYLFEHNKLNLFFKKNVLQNQFLLIYGAIALLAYIIVFSFVGIVLSPIIPLMIMVSTTLFVLFNSYRVQRAIDQALDKNHSSLKQFLASDLSIGVLVSASLLLNCGLFISTITMGGFVLPMIAFTAGTMVAIGSACLLVASALFSVFVVLLGVDLLIDCALQAPEEVRINGVHQVAANDSTPCVSKILPKMNLCHGEKLNMGFAQSHQRRADEVPRHDIEIEAEQYGFKACSRS